MSLATFEVSAGAAAPGSRTVTLAGRKFPLVPPRLSDARLHIAAVTMTLHVLGQTVLGFRVSIPQILVAIVAPAGVELARTFRRSGALVWPASAMLTGSGVALILRAVGTEAGDHWTWQGWHLFALVSVGSLATKYLITYRGGHVFNPSNVGLVVAFVVLGSSRVEPLDFWWAPLNPAMITAYLVIVAGGLAITGRLGLAGMGLAFWATLAATMGALSMTGHCITAAWSPQPVCGTDFGWTVMTSPEVAIFLFFMITDPRTVPSGRATRLVFAIAVAVVSSLLMAPQTTEFGAKVGLLAGLTIMSPLRYPLESAAVRRRLRLTSVDGIARSRRSLVAGGAAIGSVAVAVLATVAATGAPARSSDSTGPEVPTVDVSTEVAAVPLPPIEVIQPSEVAILLGDLSIDEFGRVLVENLAIENAAGSSGDGRLLLAASSGPRLADRERAVALSVSDGVRVTVEHDFTSLTVEPLERDGSQAGAALAVEATGTALTMTTDAGDGQELERRTDRFDTTFVLRQNGEGRWLIADAL